MLYSACSLQLLDYVLERRLENILELQLPQRLSVLLSVIQASLKTLFNLNSILSGDWSGVLTFACKRAPWSGAFLFFLDLFFLHFRTTGSSRKFETP